MKHIVKPTVTMLAVPKWATTPPYAFTPDEPAEAGLEEFAVETLPEFAGRLCYLSFGEDVDAGGHATVQGRTSHDEYMQNIVKVRHGSVVEHTHISFLIEGVSRSLTHELVRHRQFSYSQLSQRYVDESEVAFVVPPDLLTIGMENSFRVWHTSCKVALGQYCDLMKQMQEDLNAATVTTALKKRLRQAARSVLPNCTETKIVMTGNLRAWRDFLIQRGSPSADLEIRRLALVISANLLEIAPNVFGDAVFQPHETRIDTLEFSQGRI